MLPAIIIATILIVAAAAYLFLNSSKVVHPKKNYLDDLAYYFESKVEPNPEAEGSFRVVFNYEGYACFYEDVAVPTRLGEEHLGYLKVQTNGRLNLSFTEKERTQIRSNVQSLDDLTKSTWGTSSDQVKLPKCLEEFQVFTNHVPVATKLVNDDKIQKIFTKYKNRETRGRPLMSLEIKDGIIRLEFHERGGLKPSLIDLRHNGTAIEPYIADLIAIAHFLKNSELVK